MRRRAATGLVVFVALWPLVTLWLQAKYDVDPWKLMSFGMYAAPARRLEDVRVRGPVSAEELERLRRLRRTLGRLVPLPEGVHVETVRLDASTARVVLHRE